MVNISNQSPCCLSTCEPNFRWTREMQNWALTQGSGTREARPQRPKRARGAVEPRHTEADAANSIPSGLETRSGDPRAASGQFPHGACEVRRTFGAGAGLFVTKSKEGQRPVGEPHVFGWAATRPARIQRRLSCRASTGAQKNISEELGQAAVFHELSDSAHLVRHRQSH